MLDINLYDEVPESKELDATASSFVKEAGKEIIFFNRTLIPNKKILSTEYSFATTIEENSTHQPMYDHGM